MILLLQSLLISPNGGMEGDIGPKGQDNHLKLSRDVSIERGHLDHLRQVPHVTEEGRGFHTHTARPQELSATSGSRVSVLYCPRCPLSEGKYGPTKGAQDLKG